jgi:hypothetical protein
MISLKQLWEDVLGKSDPIKLSDIPNAQTAKRVYQAGQIDGDDTDDGAGTKTSTSVAVGKLKPMQNEVIPDKALAFALGYLRDGTPDLDDMEAIISNDMYIMDGHHRWAARTLIDPTAQVKVAAVDMPADDLVSALNVYSKAVGKQGNQGRGDVTKFASSIPSLLTQLRSEGNAGFDSKGRWPNIDASEVDEILGKVPGANGDADKGEAIMIANAKKLPSQKHPKAPDRIDMPVIDANKGDLTKVLKMIANGEMDIKEPFASTTKSAFGIEDHKINKGSKLNESIDLDKWKKIARI